MMVLYAVEALGTCLLKPAATVALSLPYSEVKSDDGPLADSGNSCEVPIAMSLPVSGNSVKA